MPLPKLPALAMSRVPSNVRLPSTTTLSLAPTVPRSNLRVEAESSERPPRVRVPTWLTPEASMSPAERVAPVRETARLIVAGATQRGAGEGAHGVAAGRHAAVDEEGSPR